MGRHARPTRGTLAVHEKQEANRAATASHGELPRLPSRERKKRRQQKAQRRINLKGVKIPGYLGVGTPVLTYSRKRMIEFINNDVDDFLISPKKPKRSVEKLKYILDLSNNDGVGEKQIAPYSIHLGKGSDFKTSMRMLRLGKVFIHKRVERVGGPSALTLRTADETSRWKTFDADRFQDGNRFNQDALVNTFSFVRRRGAFQDNPDITSLNKKDF
ncbi:hypothetical protein HNY73_007330 [Argiope bruennichi]|uniref:Uncharacterized protein n=1 Tax=Argiope bruennichi TaxID=94029 RepID=A0A8T0FJ53_ARGBR|nr:hypothetical protein HNY73_007330 [Argiope bruennichi]